MFNIKLVFIILLYFIRPLSAFQKCVDTKTCYDEEDVKKVLNNPFLQESDENQFNHSFNNGHNKGAESDSRKHSHDNQTSCSNLDICQLTCFLTLTNLIAQKSTVGTTGPPGKRGPPGLSGPIGPPCDVRKGEPGLIGPEGDPGFPGERGSPGDKGDAGQKGESVQGPAGMPGESGRDGVMCEKGSTGIPGSGDCPVFPGATGPSGRKGEKGEQGAVIVFIPGYANVSLSESQLRTLNSFEDITNLLNRVKRGNGSKESPVKTCLDLQYGVGLDVPEQGKYWIDPNGGDISDAIEVFCNRENGATCVEPVGYLSVPKNITCEPTEQKTSNKGGVWLSAMDNGITVNYGQIYHQIGYLHLMLGKATQQIYIRCKNTVVYYDAAKQNHKQAVRLMTWNDVVLNAKSGPPDLRFDTINDECSESTGDQLKLTIVEYKTNKSHRLPIIDVAMSDCGRNKSFSVEVGRVCFENPIEHDDEPSMEPFED